MRGHVESCEKHPLAAARAQIAELAKVLRLITTGEFDYAQMEAMAEKALFGGSENG